ncbi:MAG: hypothetical protein QNJ97_20110 [Myxococcota bacterium]|nr:hypothetical protein [Myxococcota bacterium]
MRAHLLHHRRDLFVLLIGLVILGLNIEEIIHCGQNSGCIDPYWADFWLISYSDGYSRRALIGQLIQVLVGDIVDYRLLNAVAFFIAIAIPLLVYAKYFSRQTGVRNWSLPCIFVISGPATVLLFEVLGDLLQVSFILVIGYFFISGWVGAGASLLLAAIVSLLAVLIHEASMFAFLPAVYLIHCLRHQKRISFWGPMLVIFIGASILGVVLNTQNASMPSAGLKLRDLSIYYPPHDPLPPFSALLGHELSAYLGSIRSVAYLFIRVLGVSIVPVASVFLLSSAFNDRRLPTLFAFLSALSLPLYAIAHDWGRFSIYTFLLSLLLSSLASSDRVVRIPLFQRAIDRFTDLAHETALPPVCLCVLTLVFRSWRDYRSGGLLKFDLVLAVAAIVLVAFYVRRYSKPQQRG